MVSLFVLVLRGLRGENPGAGILRHDLQDEQDEAGMAFPSGFVLFVDFVVRIPGPGNPENSNAETRRRKAGKDGDCGVLKPLSWSGHLRLSAANSPALFRAAAWMGGDRSGNVSRR